MINMDTRLLKNYYRSIGYYDVQIKSNSAQINKKSGDIELIYSIDAGNRYIIKKIVTNADPVIDKTIFYSLNKEYQRSIGTYYSPFKVKKLLEKIDELIAVKVQYPGIDKIVYWDIEIIDFLARLWSKV